MLGDRVRMDAYTAALRKSVRQGSVVVEIGTGPGIFAVLACQMGASRVYAIEPDGVIQVAREIVEANHYAEKIEFIEDMSTKVDLPVRADVIVSDMRGVLPFFQQHIPSIVDARRRFLSTDGILIPRKDRVWAAVVEAPADYGKIEGPWTNKALKLDRSAALQLAVNNSRKAKVTAEQLLTEAKLWATLDYATIESPDACDTLHWNALRAGTGHGIVVWFETELAEGVELSNFPGMPEAIYGSVFFPWLQPVPLVAGQSVRAKLEAKLVEADYVWRWSTRVENADGRGAAVVSFDQSELNGAVLSPAKLRKAASSYVPKLSEEGRLHKRTLELMDGATSLESIAKRLATEFPKRFARWEQALSYAGKLSQEHT